MNNRKTVFVNLSNLRSAGPRQLAANFMNALREANPPSHDFIIAVAEEQVCEAWRRIPNVRLIPVRKRSWLLNSLYRLYVDFVFLPGMIARHHCDTAIYFGNFAPVRVSGTRKSVTMHHSYLVDDVLLAQARMMTRITERLKRAVFYLTIKKSDVIVVQSEYMREGLRRTYATEDRTVRIIPNPLSGVFQRGDGPRVEKEARYNLIYPSRFHPHKNHLFVCELARKLKSHPELKKVTITVTVDGSKTEPALAEYLRTVEAEGLGTNILNIGEVPQESLVDHYRNADALFFPSHSESFGNPLVEGMSFALPVLAPDLGYARAVCDEAAMYYRPGDVDAVIARLEAFYADPALRDRLSALSFERAAIFPNPRKWLRMYLDIFEKE